MTKNPFYNAFLAVGYIALVANIMNFAHYINIPEPNILIPITMLSLFVLSAASMGYLFFFQPIMLYLEGKQKDAVGLSLKTLAMFGAITFVLIVILFATSL